MTEPQQPQLVAALAQILAESGDKVDKVNESLLDMFEAELCNSRFWELIGRENHLLPVVHSMRIVHLSSLMRHK